MSTVDNFPDLRPSLLLDFANSGRVDPRIQFTRASTATCYGSDGKQRTVAANVPRIDYDPVTGKCLGLLLEEARTNLVLRSEDFSNASWAKQSATVVSSQGAYKIVANAGVLSAAVSQQLSSVSDGQDVVFSVSGKAAEFNTLRLGVRCRDGTIRRAFLNLATGEFGEQNGVTVSAKAMGGGGYRFSVSCNVGSGTTAVAVYIYPINNSNIATQGDGVSGVHVWSAQLEVGVSPTSYIPTETTSVTRAADVASLQYLTAGDSGSILVHGRLDAPGTNVFFPVRARGEGNAYKGVPYCQVSGSTVRSAYVRANGQSAAVVAASGGNVSQLQPYKSALSWSTRQFRTATNGLASADATYDFDVPAGTHLDFCATAAAGSVVGASHISQVSIYPTQLSTVALQRLTQL